MKEIICPLLTSNTVIDHDHRVSIGREPVVCLEDQCEWWIEEKQKCAIAALGGKK